jgi:hypothetical protein
MRGRILMIMYLFSGLATLDAQIVLPFTSVWKYFKGTSAPSTDNTSWKNAGFDDSSWPSGNAPFRYGDGTGGTDLSDMQNSYSSVFLRKTINVYAEDSLIDKAICIFDYDDGFRMYINGIAVLERLAPYVDRYDTFSTGLHESQLKYDTVILNHLVHGLKKGVNTVVVALYNANLPSSDIFFDINIELTQKAPSLLKGPDVQFSVNGGYFTTPFNLTLSSVNAGDTIKYTLDYSEPGTSATAISVTSPSTFNISPGMTGRPSTPAVVVRAIVMKSGFLTGSETRTYIFTESIKTQTYPGGNWPSTSINGQAIYYDIDSRIVNDSRYSAVFSSTFSSIPTVSLVTDNPNLFDPVTGIYVNALQHGDVWEVPASLELIDTNNTEDFSVNIGARIRGGWSRNAWNPKHAFRIFFNDQYGKKSLKYPIFGADAAQEFVKFDLRCAQNYSWSFYNDPMMTYAQDEYFRDAQGMMGQPHTRSRYHHLFLNGMYWGLYEFQERPEANFGASYLGGKKENFDVIKNNAVQSNVEATDGTMAKWTNLLSLTNQGYTTNTNYFKLQGLNSSEYIDTTLEALANIDNLIDYMLNIFYSGNFDAPLTIWGNNNSPNNFYAIKDRNHKREGFIFMIHDAEHTFNYIPGNQNGNQQGVNENRVDLIHRGMSQPSISNFTPQWLHYRLSSNAEYRQRFADRAYKYLYNNGLFTPALVEQYFRFRTNQINMAIISESARWGTRTKDDDWIPAINNTVNLFIKLRTPIVIQQLKDAGLLNNLIPPAVKKDGKAIIDPIYNFVPSIDITFSNYNSSGTIYYTTDGSDPRVTDGYVNASATASTGTKISIPFPLVLKARILDGYDWSPLREIAFSSNENRENLRITEIHYNPIPYGSKSSKDLEFIEFKNIGEKGIDMGGMKIDSAVKYTFPAGTIINPKGFVVIASESDGFQTLYYEKPSGQFSGNLSNSGERIVLADENNNILIDVKYGVSYPWPAEADGSGYSLVPKLISPDNTPDDPNYWRASMNIYGSPFSDDTDYVKPNGTGILIAGNFAVYPVPSSNMLFIRTKSNIKINMIQMFDISGRLLLTKYVDSRNNANAPIEISLKSMNIANGIYFLRIQSRNGNETRKVIYR